MFETFSNYIADKVESWGKAPLSDEAQQAINMMPDFVLFIASDLRFGLLISAILGAYLTRFLIRRIPFFG